MRRLTVLGVLLAALLTSPVSRADEPDIAALIKDLSSPRAASRAQAAEALGRLGPAAADAVPALATALQDKEARVRMEALGALEQIGPAAFAAAGDLLAIVENGPPNLRLGAIHALGAIGPDAAATTDALLALARGDDESASTAAVLALVRIHPDARENPEKMDKAIPVLMQRLSSKQMHVRNDAIAALGEIGAPAVPALSGAVKNHSADAALAMRAASALSLMGPEAAPAADVLLAALESKNDKLLEQVARAVGAAGPAAKSATPALAKLLASRSAGVRANAAHALGQLGAAAAGAVAELAKAVGDGDVNVRREAIQSLGEIGPPAKAAVPKLVEALHDAEGAITLHAAEALGRIGPDSIPALTKVLQDERLRSLAILVIAEMGPAAKPAVGALVPLLKDRDMEVRREALIALAQIGPGATEAESALLTDLRNDKSQTRAASAYALVKMGSKEVLPILMQTVKMADQRNKHLQEVSAWGLVTMEPDNDDYVKLAVPLIINGLTHEWELARGEAVQSLGRMGAASAPAVGDLAKMLQTEKNPALRNEVLRALGEIGPAANGALPDILKAISDTEPMIRYSAVYAAGKIGPAAKGAALPVLKANLASKDPFLPIVSAWAVVQLAPEDKDLVAAAVPLLAKALQLPDSEVRMEAIRTLASLGTQAKPALPALEQVAREGDEELKQAAAAAIKKVGG